MKARTPILMLGLDAAEWTLVQRLIDAGQAPALAGLRQRGCFGALRSPGASYAGGVWPCFYTGQDVPWHGIFHNKLWRPDAMRCEVPTDRWIASRPFWERLSSQGYRLCIVDVPMVLGKPLPINGVHLGGWGTHDLISKGAWPAALWDELRRRHGAPIMPPEYFGPQNGAALVSLTDSLLRSTEQTQRIVCELLQREEWDFSCIVFGATHRIGHYLWDLAQLDQDPLTESRREALGGALTRIYRATDAAIGRVLEYVGGDTLVIAFAVHGMGPNPGWSDLMPGILDAAQRSAVGRAPKTGLLYALRRHLPFQWARPVLRRLPTAMTDRLVALWSARMYDWRSTRHFPVPMDHAGYVRVNLRGRERDGIVDADDYDAACRAVEQVLLGLRDRDTGEQIAPEITRAYAQACDSAPYRDLIPDLIVRWQGPAATQSRGLCCDVLPALHYAVPRRLPSGRSGNHTDHGWFIASGPGAEPGLRVDGHDILDLAPTILRHLGAEPVPSLQGRPIGLRAGPSA